MPDDHKFERKYDRRKVLDDEKNRILDFSDFHQEPPAVGIYDEPVRYFKANKEWCKFIFGYFSWMQSTSFWKAAEDSNYHAIQQMLIFEEGITGEILMTPEELEAAICAAIECSAVKISKRIVSGITSGFSVDAEGNVVVDGGDTGVSEDVPEDDPLTPWDEEDEYKTGVALAYANGINSLFETLDELYTGGVPAADAKQVISATFSTFRTEALMDAAIDEYYARRTALDFVFESLNEADLAEFLFCENLNEKATPQWIMGLTSTDIMGNVNAVNLFKGLDEDNFVIWSDLWLPSTAYIAYGCTPVATEEFTLDMSTANNVQYLTNALHKAGHRIIFEVSGSFTDTDAPGVVMDFFYKHTLSTGEKLYVPSLFQIQGASGSLSEPSQAQVPFQASHSYRVTIDFSPTVAPGQITIGRDNDFFALPNVTGILTCKITDLGKYA